MRDNDIVDLILHTAKQQMNITTSRDDEIIHLINITDETITVSDTHVKTKNSHPVKWDEFVWDLATWG